MGNCMASPGQAVENPTAAHSASCCPGCQVGMPLVGCVRTHPTKTFCVEDSIDRSTSLPADLPAGGLLLQFVENF